jgi:hypothetical protein
MAYFAKLNNDNTVIDIIVVDNSELLDSSNVEQESLGVTYLNNQFGDGNWKQTSYNGVFRKRYAGVGYIYDKNRDAFMIPQPYPSWVVDEDSCTWQAPVELPGGYDGSVTQKYEWNEETTSWDEME